MLDTNLNPEEMATLFWNKFSNNSSKQVHKLPKGYKNQSLVITSVNDEKFVLKIYAQNFLTQEAIEERACIVKKLEEAGLPVLQILPGLNGKHCQEVAINGSGSFFCTVSHYIDIPFSETEVNEEVVRAVAQQLSLLHKAMSSFKDLKSVRKLDTVKILKDLVSEESIQKIDAYFKSDYKREHRKEEVKKYYIQYAQEISNYFAKREKLFSNLELNHGDFNLNNFLVLNNRIEKIFDFDDMVFAPAQYEVAVSIYQLNYSQEFYLDQLIEIFLSNYYESDLIDLELVNDIVMFMKYRAFYRFARFFTYYQFTNVPGGHFIKFKNILDRLDGLDPKQIYKFTKLK